MKKCPKCYGCGSIDNIDGLPWSMANDHPHKRDEIRSGKRFHIACDACNKTGQVEDKKEQPEKNPE